MPPFTNISAGRHKYCWRGGGNTNKIFCGLITQIKLVNHGSTGEVRTPATRVITNTATEVPHTDVTAILICYLVCTHSKISMHTYFSCAYRHIQQFQSFLLGTFCTCDTYRVSQKKHSYKIFGLEIMLFTCSQT